MSEPAWRQAAVQAVRLTRADGGFVFAERPDVAAPDARLIWRADFDPGTLFVRADPARTPGPDSIDLAQLAPWLSIIIGESGSEHAVLSDGWHRIRIDVAAGSLASEGPVILRYEIAGVETAIAPLLSLRRLLHLCRHRRFARALFPADKRMDRWLTVLRTYDALTDGASQYDIARALFGEARIDREWRHSADALRSQVRRLVREARHMAGGGYRSLMRRSDPSP